MLATRAYNKGFTLIEIVVVCAIIVIVSTTAVSIMAGMGEKNSLREVKVKIPVILENLSWKAMERGEIVEVMFDFNKKTVLCKNDEKVC
jgi:prepilin-type N-terminal cleavage/methylation domain-containing protein